jgi:hypothetical protein
LRVEWWLPEAGKSREEEKKGKGTSLGTVKLEEYVLVSYATSE